MATLRRRKLIWHPEAVSDLKSIVDSCREYFGKLVAGRVRSRILEGARLLISHPALGFVEPLLTDCPLQYRSLVIVPCTKVIYTVHEAYVYIHILWNTRRNEQDLPKIICYRSLEEATSRYLLNEPEEEYSNKRYETWDAAKSLIYG